MFRHLRIESDGYSFGYLAAWAGGGDEALAAIRASGTRIRRATAQIVAAFAGVGGEPPPHGPGGVTGRR